MNTAYTAYLERRFNAGILPGDPRPKSLSICIATHERPALLKIAVLALARQSRLADEVIVSDSSSSNSTLNVLSDLARNYPCLRIKHVRSSRKSLPWQRWLAFCNSVGDIVLFLDDDVELKTEAVRILFESYASFGLAKDCPAGIGFVMSFPDGSQKERYPYSFEERWLGISQLPSGSVLPGGTSIPPKMKASDHPIPVQRLWGGAMSFRREVIESIGPLTRLFDLYENRLGRGEDAVLSWYAGRRGSLFILTQSVAVHPEERNATRSAYAAAGWRLGMTETWGRSHTMRWMALSKSALAREWCRVAGLEIVRALWWGIFRQPLRPDSWSRFGGAIWGTIYTVMMWPLIPSSPMDD